MSMRLRGSDRIDLAQWVARDGENAVTNALHVSSVALARAVAGFSISERVGKRIVAGVWADVQRHAAPDGDGGARR